MSSSAAVVCREIFDDNSQPSAEEVSEYAQQIGIDPDSETHLLPLAKDGLMQALPPPWKAYFDEKLETHYYYNEDTKKTQWEHPLDRVYRDLVRRARDSSTHDDTCASVQELLTSEENTKNAEKIEAKIESEDEDLSTDCENGSDIRDPTIGTSGRRLHPLSGRPPLAPLTRPIEKKLNDLRVSPLRRSIDSTLPIQPVSRAVPDLNQPFDRPKLFKQQSEIIDLKMHVLNSPDDENFSPLMPGKAEKGFALAGKGSMFLKTKKPDLPSPDTEKSLPLDSLTKSDPPKGILREKPTDLLQRRTADVIPSKPRSCISFEDDRKIVRFNLQNSGIENAVSPGSNSSSEQNEGQSVISTPPVVPSPKITPSSPNPSLSSNIPSSLIVPPSTLSLFPPKLQGSPITLAPLLARPPLPPRPLGDNICSPRESSQRNSVSGSDRESNESDSKESRGLSPKRRVLRPPAIDYIKPELFQKNFHKISDIIRPKDFDTSPGRTLSVEEPAQKETRPRSPLIPQMTKISINLMESIDSETSTESPDREYPNTDLNDFDDFNDVNKDKETADNNKSTDYKVSSDSSDDDVIHSKTKINSNSEASDVKRSSTNKEENADYRTNSRSESLDLGVYTKELYYRSQIASNTQLKLSPSPSISGHNDIKSPKLGLYTSASGWTSPFKPTSPTSKVGVTPQIKSPESNVSLTKVTSPRLDGVILSQSKSAIKGSDDVVVVYQFESNADDNAHTNHLFKTLNQDANKEAADRNKADEKRRLELVLQKALEEIRMEWAAKEKRMRTELMEECREAEEKFVADKSKRLLELAEKQRREIEEAAVKARRNHEDELKSLALEYDGKLRREAETAEKKLKEALLVLKNEHSKMLADEQARLQKENERILLETRDQLQAELMKSRSELIEQNRSTIEAMREEHSEKVTELRQDYRVEVERLRTQHACHLQELRARLAAERASLIRGPDDAHAISDKYRCLKEKYARLKHDVKMSLERRNKRRELSMTTGSETEKSNSHKATQSLERCKELNEMSASGVEPDSTKIRNNNPTIKYNDNETSLSESNAQKSITDNNNEEWRSRKEMLISPETSQYSNLRERPPRKVSVAFREPPRRRRAKDSGIKEDVTTDCADSSDATTADEKPKEAMNGHGRRRCFTRLKSASTSRLNYSPKRGDGWSSPLESLRQQLRKLDDLEDQFPDLACQPAYSLRYPFTDLSGVSAADTPELEFVRHRALVEREGMRRARATLRRRRAALTQARAELEPPREPSEEREATELEVALHRARAMLGEKEIRLRHIERSLRQLSAAPLPPQPPVISQEGTTSEASSGSDLEVAGHTSVVASGAVLKSLRALHADVRDIWLALDARRPNTVSPEQSSCNMATTSQQRVTAEISRVPELDNSVSERARGLRAWLQAP